MGYSNLEGVLANAMSIAEDAFSDRFDARYCKAGVFAVVWTGASATDAVVKLQESVDGITWFDVASMTVTIAAAAGSALWKLTDLVLLSPLYRVAVVDNTESTGTVTVKYFLKGDH